MCFRANGFSLQSPFPSPRLCTESNKSAAWSSDLLGAARLPQRRPPGLRSGLHPAAADRIRGDNASKSSSSEPAKESALQKCQPLLLSIYSWVNSLPATRIFWKTFVKESIKNFITVAWKKGSPRDERKKGCFRSLGDAKGWLLTGEELLSNPKATTHLIFYQIEEFEVWKINR